MHLKAIYMIMWLKRLEWLKSRYLTMIYIKHRSSWAFWNIISNIIWCVVLKYDQNISKHVKMPCHLIITHRKWFWGNGFGEFSVGIFLSWSHSMLSISPQHDIHRSAWERRRAYQKSIKILCFVMCWVNTKITKLSKLRQLKDEGQNVLRL